MANNQSLEKPRTRYKDQMREGVWSREGRGWTQLKE